MGEYERLNKMILKKEEKLNILREMPEKSESDYEEMADIEQSIGEIKGALFEMAEMDGLDDPYDAFMY